MAPSKKKPRTTRPASATAIPSSPGPLGPSGETRAADAVTVAWMISTFATFIAVLVAVIAWAIVAARGIGAARGSEERLAWAMPRLAVFVALATSLVVLFLSPLTLKVRRQPPPRQITIAAYLICIVPWLLAVGLYFFAPR